MTLIDSDELKSHARTLGFNRVGISPARPSPHLNAYLRWLANGYHGTMGYLARPDRVARRQDLNVILPDVQSVIMVGLDYTTLHLPPEIENDPARGRIASYAWGTDYHTLLGERLQQLADWLIDQLPDPPRTTKARAQNSRVYVDTGAILERDHGQQAGLGFTGKNTLLIDPRGGSFFFLGTLLTTFEADHYDIPGPATRCGTCQRCQDACPTHAFPEPFVLDARRCISYLTIEYKDVIDPALRPAMGRWVYGCDICQTVCPWNRFAMPAGEPDFYPLSVDSAAPSLESLLTLDNTAFQARFSGSAIERIGRDRLVRNACIAAGNSQHPLLQPILTQLAESDRSEVVRESANWGLAQFAG